MNVPSWIKLAAASNDELLEEVLNTIEEMGGIDKAQEALRQSNKKANWVTREKYVVSKSVTDIGRELGQQALKEREEVKPIKPTPEKPKDTRELPSVEAPEEKPAEKPKEEPKEENQFQGPPTGAPDKEKMSQGSYLATLLGMFLAGVGGTLGAQQIGNIDLRHELLNVVNKEQGLNSRIADRLRDMLEGKPDLPRVDVSREVGRGMANQHDFQIPSEIKPAEDIMDQLPQEGDVTEIPKEIQPEEESHEKRSPYKGKREKKKEDEKPRDPEEPE